MYSLVNQIIDFFRKDQVEIHNINYDLAVKIIYLYLKHIFKIFY
ncbi:hypothetical protein LEP1GSC186_3729 [Leptospira noguchii serovar Autumnalis str. ZUN142]|uniref:Uncharacterized protein n=1 Tax=Leptospira noguchii serovar Autumnalis str. ZUN142 TaxID=1085540 RepID=M6UTS5_9LEPT|nr:hypothetical protein LEP1GSC072_4138 [Leptospira noguchii str. Bonito]EMO40688.1 hypothetical protein LEP1GSC186_3729 [Leptospira noguchii serovar Autumnalis str. ZUN142]